MNRNRKEMSAPPPKVRARLRRLREANFVDDGCTNSPDAWFQFDFEWACALHDAAYCTRWNQPGSMTQAARKRADRELGANIRGALPWRWRWVGWVYRVSVRRYGGRAAYDSCGPLTEGRDPETGRKTGAWIELPICRHALAQPAWMQNLS